MPTLPGSARTTAAGARSYVFNYRVKGSGQQRRVTIGATSNWSAGSAPRAEARRLRRLVDAGQDPRGEQEEAREAPTMVELIDRFTREVLPRKRPHGPLLHRHVEQAHQAVLRKSHQGRRRRLCRY